MSKSETLLQKLDRVARERKLERFSKDSYDWFMKKAQGISPRGESLFDKIVKEQTSRNLDSSRPQPGMMYLFSYDAKTKAELPYWDKHPLIILFDRAKDNPNHFFGLNCHYLPLKLRSILFDSLLEIFNAPERLGTKDKFKISYGILKRASISPLYKPCFMSYLAENVKGTPVKIPPKEYESALFMPLQNFQKASASTVWRDSAKYR